MSYIKLLLLPILCEFLLSGTARGEEAKTAPPLKMPASMAELDSVIPIKPGHVVAIQILEDKRDALQQVVAVTGELLAPYVGLTKVSGLTCRELANQLKAELEKSFFEEATVLVLSTGKPAEEKTHCYLPFGGETYSAMGAIAKQGIYDLPLDTDMTVSSFLARAGGHIVKNGVPKIRIFRKTPQGEKCILVNTKAVLLQKRIEFDLVLRDGDIVIVE